MPSGVYVRASNISVCGSGAANSADKAALVADMSGRGPAGGEHHSKGCQASCQHPGTAQVIRPQLSCVLATINFQTFYWMLKHDEGLHDATIEKFESY